MVRSGGRVADLPVLRAGGGGGGGEGAGSPEGGGHLHRHHAGVVSYRMV